MDFVRSLKAVSLTSILAALAACMTVDRVAIAVNNDDRIDGDLVIAQPVLTTGEITNLRNCISGSVNVTYDPSELKISVRNQTIQQSRESLLCLKNFDKYAELSLEKSDGLLSLTKKLIITLRIPIATNRGDNTEAFMPLPRQFTVDMPGEIQIKLLKSTPALSFESVRLSSSSVNLKFAMNSAVANSWVSGRESQCLDPNMQFREPCVAEISVEISNNENRFGLSDLLSFFSILFGSGIAVTIGSRVLAIRTEKKPVERK